MTSLTPLDIFLIVSTVVVAIVGIYLVIILHRVTRATKVMDRVTMTAMKFQDAFAIVEKIPTNIVRKVTDSLPSKKSNMKAINTILSIVIACLVLLIGWQWYHLSQNQQTITNTQPITKIRPIPTPTTSSEIVVDKTQDTQEVISTTDSVNDTSNDTTSQETGVIVLGDEPVNSDIAHAPQDTILETEIPVDDLALYENTMYGYSVAIPKNMYYAGFGARDGALHTLALQSDDVPEDFSSADIRVYYYGNKVLPDLVNAENNRYEDPAGKYVLLLLNGKTSVRIESANINSPEVLVLIQTISAGE